MTGIILLVIYTVVMLAVTFKDRAVEGHTCLCRGGEVQGLARLSFGEAFRRSCIQRR
jgi:hypothetical protein